MKFFGRELEGFPKALVLLIAILLVSSGLCGITGEIEAKNGWSLFGRGLPNTALGSVLSISDFLSAAAIALSAVGIAFVLVAWPIGVLYARITHSEKDRVLRLFGDEDETDADDRE
jgi:hypothetical protein